MKKMTFLEYLETVVCNMATWQLVETYGSVELTDPDMKTADGVNTFIASHTLGAIYIEAMRAKGEEKIRIYKWAHTSCILEIHIGEEESTKIFHLPIDVQSSLLINTIRSIIAGD